MATSFPVSLDALVNPTPTDDVSVVSHADQHANANDAIEALEAKVGIDASANTSSLDYLLKNTSSLNPGHKHTAANITDFNAAAVTALTGQNISLFTNNSGYITGSSTTTFTNKSFNANGTGNSITNLETADFATNVVDNDVTLAANSSTRLPTQFAVRNYVDNLITGLSWKTAVKVATTGNGTLATAFENGDTVDGVVLATGDRILIKDQTTASQNGIYIVQASGAPVRATDADVGSELVNATVLVSQGTTNADTQWTCTTNGTITIGVTSLAFAKIAGAGTYTGGFGITLTGNSFAVNLAETKYEWTGDHTFRDNMFRLNNPAASFQYFFRTSAIVAAREILVPLMTANGEMVITNHPQTLDSKTLTSPVLNTSLSGTAFLDEDNFASNAANKTVSQQSARAFVENGDLYVHAVAGRYYGPRNTARFPGTAGVIADWTFFAPFYWGEPFTLDKVSLNVTTGAAGNARIGIWADGNGSPAALIRDCGTVDTTATGVKEITGLAQSMARGRFWLGFQTNAVIGIASWGTALGHAHNSEIGNSAFVEALVLQVDFFSSYAGGLPNPATPSLVGGADVPQMCWRL